MPTIGPVEPNARAMPPITLKNLDEKLLIRLQIRALTHGCTVEEEIQQVLAVALDDAEPAPKNLVGRIRRRLRTFSNAPPPAPPAKTTRPPTKKARGAK